MKEAEIVKENFPYLYKIGQKNLIFTHKNFLLWTMLGAIEGGIIFYVTTYVFDN